MRQVQNKDNCNAFSKEPEYLLQMQKVTFSIKVHK